MGYSLKDITKVYLVVLFLFFFPIALWQTIDYIGIKRIGMIGSWCKPLTFTIFLIPGIYSFRLKQFKAGIINLCLAFVMFVTFYIL